MQYLNLETAFFAGRAWRANAPTERATFISLLAFCAAEENGGTLAGASSWGERKWLQLIGCTKEESMGKPMGELSESERLWHWDGGDLVLSFYPSKQEAAVQAKRDGGKKGAAKRWGSKGDSLPIEKPYGTRHGERKGKEVHREGGKATSTPSAPAPEILEMMGWVAGLHPHWGKPAAWSVNEVKLVEENREVLVEISTGKDSSARLAAYLRASIGKEERFWPKTRSQFASDPADVDSKAREWAKRRRWSPPRPAGGAGANGQGGETRKAGEPAESPEERKARIAENSRNFAAAKAEVAGDARKST